MDVLYVNAYAVTRHYGGPEEGGWWYNAGEPLASIPVLARRVDGHDEWCYNCNRAREDEGEFCKKYYEEDPDYVSDDKYWDRETLNVQHLKPVDDDEVHRNIEYLKKIHSDEEYGNIYHSTGGVELVVCVEARVASYWPDECPRYE